ncbi:hypothetical protein [Clostridium botulinum]|uniref:Uncharacterized protein n=1 Tax=Clostridium botulinum TaxID=1491 RepID=A0A1L7JMU5_CLOBO|nr:hypothetical protein [Clostridium botulinum]APU87100.1 hypothetical protein NPD8_4220 [Clostridium botulinum]
MKVELSNRELKDIYNGLIVFTTHEPCYISQNCNKDFDIIAEYDKDYD